MARFTPKIINSTYNSTASLNDNFDTIAALFEKAYFRDATPTNSLEAMMDANHYRIQNLATGVVNTDAANVGQIVNIETDVASLKDRLSYALSMIPVGLDPPLNDQKLYPEQFGAVGDGVTNDIAAFRDMCDYLNAVGGGVIALRPQATYAVQSQHAGGPTTDDYAIFINGCNLGVVVEGNGATIKVLGGGKYGSFNPATGLRYDPPGGAFYTSTYYNSPLATCIRVDNCDGGVLIQNLEIDGNILNQTIGGRWGDQGYQLENTGIQIGTNTCNVIVKNVQSHHWGTDGSIVWWMGAEVLDYYPVMLIDCDFHHNGRQGLSWTGGVGLYALRCRFRDTSQGLGFTSTPGDGVDIEPQSSICHKGRFHDCEFTNNYRFGINHFAGAGNARDIIWTNCTFVGSNSICLWLTGSEMARFIDCKFYGGGVGYGGHVNPFYAARFFRCLFSADVNQSPTGHLYFYDGLENSGPGNRFWGDGGSAEINTRFVDCVWDTAGKTQLTLPYSAAVQWHDCSFIQDGTGVAETRGYFYGVNRFVTAGTVDHFSVENYGIVLINGVAGGYTRRQPGTLLVRNGALGYDRGTGTGSSVTQLTSKTTGVTVDTPTGKIITHAQSMDPGARKTFQVTNSYYQTGDLVILNLTGSGAYEWYDAKVSLASPADGWFFITLTNNYTTALAEPLTINFAIIKGAWD